MVDDSLQILSWNVWFEDVEFDTRMKSIISIITKLCPSFVCLQEVTPRLIQLLHENLNIKNEYDISSDHIPDTSEDYGYSVLTLARKELQCSFDLIPLPTTMGRHLVVAHYGSNLTVGNIHLESLDNHDIREEQIKVCYDSLETFTTSILAGDFNFCSYRNYDPRKKILENDCLTTYLPGYDDLWPKLHNSNSPTESNNFQTNYSSPVRSNYENKYKSASYNIGTPEISSPQESGVIIEHCSEEGYTFDSHLNGLLSYKNERMRYDRIMMKSDESWMPQSIDLIGTKPLDSTMLFNLRGRHVIRGLWPSDHFGLYCILSGRKTANRL